jgi:hypothetical protein
VVKICPKCSSTDINAHGKCKPCAAAYMREWGKNNKDKISFQNKKYKRENPEKFRDSKYRTLFGITAKEYDNLLLLQNNLCAICGKAEKAKHQSGKIRSLAIDHCHTTGKVRGLLCTNCNTALGLLKEDLNIVLNLYSYIKER